MGIIKGQNVILKIGSVIVAGSTSHSMDMSSAMIDTTSKDSQDEFEESIPGRRNWNMSVEALYDPTGTYNAVQLIEALKAGTLVDAYFGGIDSGDVQWYGTAYIENVNMDSPMDEKVTLSATLKGTGTLDTKTLT